MQDYVLRYLSPALVANWSELSAGGQQTGCFTRPNCSELIVTHRLAGRHPFSLWADHAFVVLKAIYVKLKKTVNPSNNCSWWKVVRAQDGPPNPIRFSAGR